MMNENIMRKNSIIENEKNELINYRNDSIEIFIHTRYITENN